MRIDVNLLTWDKKEVMRVLPVIRQKRSPIPLLETESKFYFSFYHSLREVLFLLTETGYYQVVLYSFW